MKKDSIIDYSGYIVVKLIGPLIRFLPVGLSLFLGARIGELIFYLDRRHRAVAYANIKRALGSGLTPRELTRLTKDFYRSLGQSIVEVFLIPLVDAAYMAKYISVEGKEHIDEAFKRGKGVILVGAHSGSWELSNIICANLGFPFNLFISVQKFPRLNGLLNSYRSQKGCRFIEREGQTRQLIRVLKDNEAIGMTADQGGRSGIRVKFFGRSASMPSGAIRLALKYDACIVPSFYTRVKGPYIKAFVEPPFELKRTGNIEKDIVDNVQALTDIYEGYILRYPKDYLWTYKIWKYGTERNILILSDGKAGHLRQSEGVAGMVKDILEGRKINADISKVEVKFKSRNSSAALAVSCVFSGKYGCQGCGWCLKSFLENETYKELTRMKPDIVISCGSEVAAVNYVISRENLAKSIVLMRPSIFSVNRFDLAVMSRHDNPPKRKSVVVIEGALNPINEERLKSSGEDLKKLGVNVSKEPVVGVLIGGDAKGFRLTGDMARKVSSALKAAAERMGAELLITTSRRTSSEAEGILKKEFSGYGPCKLLVIANEKNIEDAVGGITALSNIVVTSPESISMISEAVKSERYAIVFDSPVLGAKHRRFLAHFVKSGYVYLAGADELAEKIEEIWSKRPQIKRLQDDARVKEAIKKIL